MCPAHFNSWHLIYNSSLFCSIVWSILTSSYCYPHAFLHLFSRDFMNFLVLHLYVTVSIIHCVLNLLARCLLLSFFCFFLNAFHSVIILLILKGLFYVFICPKQFLSVLHTNYYLNFFRTFQLKITFVL